MKRKHYTPKNYFIDESIGYLLKQASAAIERRLAAGLREKCPDATVAQWGILMFIGSGRCKTAAELAGAMDCDMASITRTLDRLEAKGLIKRQRSETDRRVIILSLTESGRELFPHLPEVSIDMLNKLLEGFTKEEVERFKLFLRRIVRAGGKED